MKNTTNRIPKLIRKSVDSVDNKAEVILFNSRAHGDEKTDSGWDVLLLTNYPVYITKEITFRDSLYDLELETGEALSLFIYSTYDWLNK